MIFNVKTAGLMTSPKEQSPEEEPDDSKLMSEEEKYTIAPFLKERGLVESEFHLEPSRKGEWKYASTALVKTEGGKYITGKQANALRNQGKGHKIIKDASSGIPFKWGPSVGGRRALVYEGMTGKLTGGILDMHPLKDGDVVYDKETGETGRVKINKSGIGKMNTKVEVNGKEYEVDAFMKRFILSIFLKSEAKDYSPFKTGKKLPE
jgi:hypothetical protein